jgi:hypothetical protein
VLIGEVATDAQSNRQKAEHEQQKCPHHSSVPVFSRPEKALAIRAPGRRAWVCLGRSTGDNVGWFGMHAPQTALQKILVFVRESV